MNNPFQTMSALIMLNIILSLTSGICAASQNNSAIRFHTSLQSEREKRPDTKGILDYQVSIAYWNDNFISIRGLEPYLYVGKDDNITTSFWLQVAFEYSSGWYFVNIYQSIMTKKKMHYRTDLLSIFTSMEQQFGRTKATVGFGLTARGNYGGGFIQTTYHDLRNFTPVNLPYEGNNSNGLLLLTGVEYEFLEKEILRLSGFASNCLRTGHGPGSLKTGLKLNLMNDMKANKHTLQFQLIAGHSSIYLVDNVDKYISPMFKSGLFQAALTSINLTDNFLTSFWISRNQYGLNQTYFGATLTFGWNGKRMGDLLDVLYP